MRFYWILSDVFGFYGMQLDINIIYIYILIFIFIYTHYLNYILYIYIM